MQSLFNGELITLTIEECIAENDMCVINEGNCPTFQKRDYKSILHLTLATHNIKSKIAHWEVSDKESLNDHNYIIFEIADQPKAKKINSKEGGKWKKLELAIQQKS